MRYWCGMQRFWGLYVQQKICIEISEIPNGKVHSGWTDPTQATECLVIVLVNRIYRRGTGGNNCCQMVRDISVKVHEPPSKARSQIFRSNGTEMVRYIWFLTNISGIFSRMESALFTMISYPVNARLNLTKHCFHNAILWAIYET